VGFQGVRELGFAGGNATLFSLTFNFNLAFHSTINVDKKNYRGAEKSLARPGRKQATAREDFDFHISYL